MIKNGASIRCYLGLGSNLSSPTQQLAEAVSAIEQLPSTTLAAVSPVYQSDPVGPEGQPDYINTVVAIDTLLAPLELLDHTQTIELEQGRVRDIRWGPRTLDIDLLLYGEEVISSERLTVPHYQLTVRNFVLLPLQDIAPNLQLPTGESVKELAANCSKAGISLLEGVTLTR
ncbi:2-amino-4-hydroxy-6-hydroxymethyldihydropteridine diphosphokinase [Spartinivicinus marinus]|uniref:2-amino-4-hydroxy-6- hydroxymethyldihydropteridine diphosphokinase n=1 Tax=Spartinivicinus marinus TaxID=2994442 RepID=UPI00224E768B|nr:2-amino-4-hydroxy-6-hydroxymethyldihydropteridine diphosphokinase [Spartinivicinus marinus]